MVQAPFAPAYAGIPVARPRPSRTAVTAIGVSIAVHAGLFGYLALQRFATPSEPTETLAEPPATLVTLANPPPKPVTTLAPAPAPAAASGSFMVQIGAFSSQAQADKGWSVAAGIAPGAAVGKGKKVEAIQKDGATLYRTSVTGFSSRADATAFCDKLKAAGKSCFVK